MDSGHRQPTTDQPGSRSPSPDPDLHSRRYSSSGLASRRAKSPTKENDGRPNKVERWAHVVLTRLPVHYMRSTTVAEREAHRELYERVVSRELVHGTVELAWQDDTTREGATSATLFAVFPDQKGSLSLITSALAQHGINIYDVMATSTDHGIAVDTLKLSHFHAQAATTIVQKMRPPRPGAQTAGAGGESSTGLRQSHRGSFAATLAFQRLLRSGGAPYRETSSAPPSRQHSHSHLHVQPPPTPPSSTTFSPGFSPARELGGSLRGGRLFQPPPATAASSLSRTPSYLSLSRSASLMDFELPQPAPAPQPRSAPQPRPRQQPTPQPTPQPRLQPAAPQPQPQPQPQLQPALHAAADAADAAAGAVVGSLTWHLFTTQADADLGGGEHPDPDMIWEWTTEEERREERGADGD